MKKIKVIFPDGSTADIDESDLQAALSAGAKRAGSAKSTSMVFPDGSIADINEDEVSGALKAGAVKKKVGGNTTPVESSGTPEQSVPTTLQSPLQEKPNDYSFDPNANIIQKKPVINVGGAPVKLDIPVPFSNANQDDFSAGLQARINTKTFTPEDVSVVANSMKVSPLAASAFMDGKAGTGTVINFNDIKEQKGNRLRANVLKANLDLGRNDNYEEIFATPELAGAYIDKIQAEYDNKANREAQVVTQRLNSEAQTPSTSSALSGMPYLAQSAAITKVVKDNKNAAQEIKSIVSNDIIEKITADQTLSKDEKVKKIYNLIDKRDFNNVKAAMADRLDFSNIFNSPVSTLAALGGGHNQEEIDMLNSNKGRIEFKVNKTLAAQVNYNEALKKSIAEDYASKVNLGEIDPNDETAKDYYAKRISDLDHETTQIAKEIVPDSAVYEKYPVLYKSAVVNSVNEFNAIKSGNVKGYEDGGYEGITLQEHLRNNGFDPNDQRVKDALDADNLKDYSFFGRPMENVLDVFVNTGKSIYDLAGIRDNVDILSDQKKAELFATQVAETDEYQLTTAASTAQNIANTTGQVIGQGLLQAGTAGLGRMAGLTKVAANGAAFWSSGALSSYDQAYQDSYDFVDSGVGRTAYAGLIALANGASEKIFPEIKLFQIPGVKDVAGEIAQKIGTEGFTDKLANELLQKYKNAFVDYAGKYAKNVSQETAEEVATNLFESGTRLLFGDPNINVEEAISRAKNTAIQTAIGTSLAGFAGANRDIQQERNASSKATIYNAALYPDEAMDAINIGFEQKLYGEDEKNAKIAVLNTAQNAITVTKSTEVLAGKELSRPEKEIYVANLTAEALLKKQKQGIDEPLMQAAIDEKISNLQNQRNQILTGQVVIDDNGNISVAPIVKEGQIAEQPLAPPVVPPIIAVSDAEIVPTFEKVLQVVPQENLVATESIISRVNNAENINVNEIETAQNELYTALDAAPEAAHLIEPLILKLQDYEFTTKTETRTVTETVPVEVARPITERKAVSKSISQWEGNRATVTDANGKEVSGIVNLEDGKYYLYNENGDKVAVLGETAITDRDISLPSSEQVPNPIQFDEDGGIKSITLQLNKLDKVNGGVVPDKLITIDFKDKEKALDYAIQLRAEQVGEFPQPEFDVAYEQIQREIQVEVPVNQNTNATNQQANTQNQQSNVQTETAQQSNTTANQNAQQAQKESVSPTVKSEEVKVVEDKIKKDGVESVSPKDIAGLRGEERDDKVRFTEEETKVISDHYKDVSELKRLQDEAVKTIMDGGQIDSKIGDKITAISEKIKLQEKSLPKGTIKGKINDGIPSFSDLVAFEYTEDINDWKGRVVDIGGTVYAIGMDGKMKSIPFVEWDAKTGTYKEIKKPDRAEKYGNTVPKSGEFIVSHGSPNGKIEKFDEKKLGKGFQREEFDHERFEGVYASDNTEANAILGRGYGDVHEYDLKFDNSISEKSAEKLLETHEKEIGNRLSRKAASKYIKSLGYDMIYRSEGDGTYTFVGLDVNKITPKSENKPIQSEQPTANQINPKNEPTPSVTAGTNRPVQSEEQQPEGQGVEGEVQPNTTASVGTSTEPSTTVSGNDNGGKKPPTDNVAKPQREEGRMNDKGVLSHLSTAENIPDYSREAFKAVGLQYNTTSQKEAEEIAKSVIDEYGIDDAVVLSQAEKFDGDVNSIIYAESLNRLAKAEALATTQAEKTEIAQKFAEIAIKYDEAARSKGRFNAAINYFYKKSPLGMKLKENAQRAEDFDDWAKRNKKEKSWKEFFDDMMKEPEFEAVVKEQVDAGMKKERAEARASRIKKVDDFFDSAIDKLGKGDVAYSTLIPITPKTLQTALKGMKAAYHAGESVAKLIDDAIRYITKELGSKNWDSEAFRTEWQNKLRETGTKKVLSDEEVKKRIIDRYSKKLKGLTAKQQEEVVLRSLKEIVNNNGLEYEQFRKIIADITGRGELTDAEAKRLQELVEATNKVDDAQKKVINERTEESLRDFDKTMLEASKASRELSTLLYTKPNILKRITSLLQLNTLGIAALVNNPIYNIINQISLRFPIGLVKTMIDQGIYRGAKLFGYEVLPETDITSLQVQKEFFNKLGLGLKESGGQFVTGLNRLDYKQKEIYEQQIRPATSAIELWDYSQGKTTLTKTQIFDKILQATVGVPAEAIARTLNLGDKPQRFSAGAAQAASFAKALGLKDIDYKIFIKFPREEAYRDYKAKGYSDEEAAKKADYIDQTITKEAERSTFQQDNFLNDFFNKVFGGKNSGVGGLAKAVIISPYIKIPSNAYWSYYNLVNPEVALMQSFIYGYKAFVKKRNNTTFWFDQRDSTAEKDLNEAKYWFAHAAVGIATRAAITALVSAGIFRSGNGEDETKKEREGEAFYEPQGSMNYTKLQAWIKGQDPDKVKGGLIVPMRWIGHWGSIANTIAKRSEDMTPEQKANQNDYLDMLLGNLKNSGIQELEQGIFGNTSSFIKAIAGGGLDMQRWGVNTVNLFTNIVHPSIFAQVSKAQLPYYTKMKADTFMGEIKNNLLQRSSVIRSLANEMPPSKIGVWGDRLDKKVEGMSEPAKIALKVLGISKMDDDNFAQPIYEDYKRTTDTRFFPSAVMPVIEDGGKTHKLNVEQTTKLEEYIGRARKDAASKYVNNMATFEGSDKYYKDLTDQEKISNLKVIYDYGYKAGKQQFLDAYPQFKAIELSDEERQSRKEKAKEKRKLKKEVEESLND